MNESIFQRLYCDDPYDIESIRKKPIQKDEFVKYANLKDEEIKQYFSLVKELYKECLLYNSGNDIFHIPSNYDNNVFEYFRKYVEFCYTRRLINEEQYDYFFKHVNSQFFIYKLEIFLGFFVEEMENLIYVDPIETFRMKLEQLFVIYRSDWYLNLRYNCYIVYNSNDKFKEPGPNKIRILTPDSNSLREMDRNEIISLVKKIENDIQKCYASEKELKENAPKQDFGYSAVIMDWINQYNDISTEIDYLEDCKGSIIDYYFGGDETAINDPSPVLFIYKGRTRCHMNSHKIEQATAIVHDINDNEVKINVEHCSECDCYYLSYDLFNRYREKYHSSLIGNFSMDPTESAAVDLDLALESPLKLSGYNVGQADGLSDNQRHYILARIIHNEIMSKGDVIKYISHFIKMNGMRKNNEIALSKWKNDLEFVQNYDIDMQPRIIIKEAKKY